MISTMKKQVLENRDFQKLVSVRRWVAWSFLLTLLGFYLAFGLMMVYTPEILAAPVGAGGIVPFGVVMGYGILTLTFIITLVYVWIANGFFAPLEKKIVAEIGESL
jgi:uncharacterized membrane protein (DUF485 family)